MHSCETTGNKIWDKRHIDQHKKLRFVSDEIPSEVSGGISICSFHHAVHLNTEFCDGHTLTSVLYYRYFEVIGNDFVNYTVKM